MGYNTTLIVLNDALGHIERDTEFGQSVAEAVKMVALLPPGERVDIQSGGHCNAASVICSAHADEVSLIAVGGNHGTVLHTVHNGGRHLSETHQRELLKELADKYGYDLVAKA